MFEISSLRAIFGNLPQYHVFIIWVFTKILTFDSSVWFGVLAWGHHYIYIEEPRKEILETYINYYLQPGFSDRVLIFSFENNLQDINSFVVTDFRCSVVINGNQTNSNSNSNSVQEERSRHNLGASLKIYRLQVSNPQLDDI